MAQPSTLPVRQSATARLSVQRAVRNYSVGFSALLGVGLLLANVASEQGGFGLTDQLANVAPVAIAAIASAPSMIGGGFDLSISPLMCLTKCVFVVWLAPHGLGGAISVPIMLGLGLAVGALNGLLIIALRVQPIVVTLAMYFSLQGVDLLIAPNPVSLSSTGWVRHLAASVGPVPGGLLTIGIPMLIWVGLRFVPFRRLLYAVGSNDATAFSSGVNVNVVRVASYALGGFFAGFGGLALTGLVSSADSSNATEYALVAIAAVVLGGTPLVGGRGGLLGPLLGAFSIYLLQNLLATFAINPAYLQIVYGGILVVAVVLGGAVSRETGGGLKRAGAPLISRRRDPQQALTLPETLLAKRDEAAAVAPGRETGAAAMLHTAGGKFGALQSRVPIAQVVALIAVFAYGVITLPGLGAWTSIRSILVLAALVGLASGGQTLLILIGGFDLGVSGFIVAGALTVTALPTSYHLPLRGALLF